MTTLVRKKEPIELVFFVLDLFISSKIHFLTILFSVRGLIFMTHSLLKLDFLHVRVQKFQFLWILSTYISLQTSNKPPMSDISHEFHFSNTIRLIPILFFWGIFWIKNCYFKFPNKTGRKKYNLFIWDKSIRSNQLPYITLTIIYKF